LNADLASRAEALQEINRQLEAFNYTVAHDLRKPLTVINGYSQILMEFCNEQIDQQSTGYLQIIYDTTLKMSELINDLLNFSQLAHAELCPETVDLSNMVKNVAEDLQQTDPKRQTEFRIMAGIKVEADMNLLRVVMDNLVGNAWKFTAHREDALIEFGRTKVNGKTAFFLRDNGLGFNMQDAEKLFLPFQRLTGAKDISGFGIGLATVERIISRHGGEIWAEGEPGKGASFYFTLSP
jgi:light-regulated signal transduction histidine kinase (bacteriophytochrome)